MRPNAWKNSLLGAEPGPWHARLGTMWKRVVAECGAADKLAADHNIVWNELPHETKICLAVGTHNGEVLDIAAAALRTRIKDWQREGRYARIRRSMPEDLVGLVPADVGALRSGLLTPKDFRTSDYSGKQVRIERLVRALTGTAAYLSAAHMIPASLALDVVTASPLDAETLTALRLPAPWSLVVHEPVTLAAAEADDTELAQLIEAGQCAGHEPAILGGLLAASDDGSLDTTAGFLLLTALDGSGRRLWMLQHAAYGDHAGGCVLYGYAAQLAFARWLQPPTLPDPGPGSRPGSRSALARAVRSEAGQGGGWHHVRVLDFTPPPDEPPPERAEPTDTGTPLTTGTWRRAHWKPGVCIGVRDAADRLVGPVYKNGAIEGVTFTRQPRFFPRTRMRPDLPLAPITTVYRPLHTGSPTTA
ncbi:hypothetical protein PBV52_14195 [Streptomyces sp. T12]|uniref:hypothetical protein n=1 Tax=Streptomyces sp. T12 TaxID=477697 RepID=UPI0023663294|nr:hypothetical protein [Streptomyces sp. T12]WDF37867.1 hypothetical protein PBV52_14195 [Streptomyces sp. T12]